MKNKISLFVLGALILLASSWLPTTNTAAGDEKGMIKITILYPNGEGKTFDMDYYANNHMPMVAELMGDAMKGFAIDKGIAGRTPEDAIPYLAIGYLYFDSLEAYGQAFDPVAEQILNDIPNYTNIQPVVQVSEVLK